jgi:starch-binding outer membrane protein SusE/F
MQNSKVTIQRIPLEIIIMVAIVIFVSSLITSCDSYEEDYAPRKTDKPVLKSTVASVDLKQKQGGNTAFTLSWTPGSNDGTNSAITYTVEVDQKGNNFGSAYQIDAGKGSYNSNFKVEDLNNLLRNDFSMSAGSPVELEFRIISQALDPAVGADTSNVVSITATPYEPLPVPETLYMVGDATPNGWDAGNPTPMTRSSNDASVFVYQGQVANGELKFITTIGSWLPSYQKGADDTSLLLRTDFSQPDEKFRIAQSGLYKITVDVIELTFAIEALAVSPYSELWIVGSAAPKGWDIDNADMMVQSLSDPFVFTFNEVLTAGEFKIATAKNWGAEFYRPVSADQPITDTDIQLSAGDPDHKWVITEPGPYKITLDLRENKITIKAYTPYENLWMVGDATPAGWNIAAPVPMTKESDYLFTWTGQLNVGEFKFPIATGDWGTGFFMPYNADESINQTLMTFRPNGSPDTKWKVKPGEEGIYKIALDQLHHTISIQKQ